MITEIILKFGSKGTDDPLKFSPGAVTIFVGPNNSGKSLILQEIANYCDNGLNVNSHILNALNFEIYTEDKLHEIIDQHKINFSPGETQSPGLIKYGKINSVKGHMQRVVNLNTILQWQNDKNSYNHFCSHIHTLFSARFTGKNRFELVDDVISGDLNATPNTNLMALFQNDIMRKQVSSIIFQAFGKYFVIDPTDMGKLKIRLSDTSTNPEIERGWHQEAVNFHKNAIYIKEFSDGVQAFTGLILATIVGNEKYILIDEPEAFLHPHLANLLGKKLSELMSKRDGNLIVATHSPHFVMGCIQSGKKVNIVRLTYDGKGNSTARLLPSEKVNELFKNPLLRSTGTIQALSFNNVIITESDADRAFYNEINERKISNHTNENKGGIDNCLFINAQNKQTIWPILRPLRELGIPAAAIVDIDIIKDGGQEFTKILQAAQIPEGLHLPFANLRNSLKSKFEATNKNMKTDGGIELLDENDKEAFNKFISDFREYGIFILKNGELESWLQNLGCTGHGPSWLLKIFAAMGDDPENKIYLKPTNDDVWEFINIINIWFNNPHKKGIK